MKNLTQTRISFVGITGYIGAGKSSIVKDLNQLGLSSIDCDQVAKDLLWDEAVQSRLIPLLGSDAFVNKTPKLPFIASRVFGNFATRQAVNGIIHPLVWEKVKETSSILSGVILIESALLLTIPIPIEMKLLVEVTCDESVRLLRLMSFRHMNEDDVRIRMKLQSEEQRIRFPDVQIDTTHDTPHYPNKIRRLYLDILRSNNPQT